MLSTNLFSVVTNGLISISSDGTAVFTGFKITLSFNLGAETTSFEFVIEISKIPFPLSLINFCASSNAIRLPL